MENDGRRGARRVVISAHISGCAEWDDGLDLTDDRTQDDDHWRPSEAGGALPPHLDSGIEVTRLQRWSDIACVPVPL